MANREDTIKTKIEIDGEKEYRQACKSINASLREIGSEMDLLSATYADNADSTEALTKKQEILRKELAEHEKKADAASKALKNLEDAGRGNTDAAQKFRTALNNARVQVVKTTREIEDIDQQLTEMDKSLDEATDSTVQFDDALDNVQDSGESFSGLLDGLEQLGLPIDAVRGKINNLSSAFDNFGVSVPNLLNPATLAIAGVATAFGKCVVEGVKFADETTRAMGDFAAKTGIATEATGDFEKVLLDIYSNGFGDSLDDVSEAMATIVQTTGELDPSIVGELANNAMLLEDAFGFDVQEQMRAVTQLMNQFGITSEEAFNLIAQGAQGGLDKNGDLLDSINEYSQYFAGLGLSGEEMFNSLKNGVESGAFSVDKLGDAIKEFSIRVVDGSDTTKDAIQSLGLDVDTIKEAFGAGGESAKMAFQSIMAQLIAIEDPIERNRVGVELFGTQWEDLGDEAVLALANMAGSIDTTKDSLAAINDIKYNDIESATQHLGREIKVLGGRIGGLFEPFIVDGINGLAQGVSDFNDLCGEIGTKAEEVTERSKQAWGALKTVAGRYFADIKNSIIAEDYGAANATQEEWMEANAELIAGWEEVWGGSETWANIADRVRESNAYAVESATGPWEVGNRNLQKTWTKIYGDADISWKDIGTVIASQTEEATSAVQTEWDIGLEELRTLWSDTKTDANTSWTDIGTAAEEATKSKQEAIAKAWSGIKDAAVKSFSELEPEIKTPIDNAKSWLDGKVADFKSAFSFSWTLPSFKLPKINVNWEEIGWGLSIPKLSVSWNALGGIFRSPTILQSAAGLQGVGEKGAEAILPLKTLWREMGAQMDQTMTKFSEIVVASNRVDLRRTSEDIEAQLRARRQSTPINITQHIYAENTDYIEQQRRAAAEFRQVAREVIR